MSTPIKVFDTYPGGKAAEGTVQALINLIPPHDVFVSPFLGNCAVMRHIRAADVMHGTDLDRTVVAKWKRATKGLGYKIERRDGIELVHDCCEWLSDLAPDQRVFIFLDPPYLVETLSRNNAKPYKHMLTLLEHQNLLHAIKQLPCMVMICALPNVVYENALAGWHTVQYRNKTRRGMQWEQVWMNYAPPTELHDYRYIGKNKRARLSWKRKWGRWVANFKRMDSRHRAAMLQYLTDANAGNS